MLVPAEPEDNWEIAVVVKRKGGQEGTILVSRQEGTMLVDGRVRYRLDDDMTYS